MKCPTCFHGTLKYAVKLKPYTYKGYSFELPFIGYYCDNCPECVMRGGDIEELEKLLDLKLKQIEESL